MKKLVKNKNLIIMMLCITIILLSIGFTLISMRLANQEENMYDVEIVNIQQGTAIRGGTILPTGEASITNNGKTADFTFQLSTPNDTLTYIVTIKNNGNLKAKIDGLAESPDYLNDNNQANSILPVIVNHNDIVNQELNPGEEINLTITAEFASSGQATKRTVPYEISILTSCIQ